MIADMANTRAQIFIFILIGLLWAVPSLAQKSDTLASPDRRIVVEFYLDAAGSPHYSVLFEGKPILQSSRLGLVREDAVFSRDLKLLSSSPAQPVQDRYEILTAKRRLDVYRANRRVFHLRAAEGQKMDIIFQVSNDGVAFRYVFPEQSKKIFHLKEEVTSYHFLPATHAWLQPMAVAKSGWSQANPSYEEYYEKDIPAGTPSPTGAGWVYPALFRSGETWLLISETALSRNYCGTRLRSESPNGEYIVGFPDAREVFPGGVSNPESTLPWATPWRIIAIGSLKTIAESTLGVDLADKPSVLAAKQPQPGKASWSWILLGDPQTTYDVQKRFIDYAAEMGWRYCLIDALWDKQIGYEKVKELVDYARAKNVGILLWYNSAGSWNTTPQTPRNIMLTHESRVREFERLKAIGIAGLKIDFFGGDGQSMIAYYHDILQDAAPYGFMMNFHGATLPRGWQRTYPNLMTMEGIRGMEFATFEQRNADEEPSHAAMLPFTRNVFDPMDFTPMVLDRLPHTERRTTSAFELALSVLFTSGLQHYAETPEGMAKAPDYVREFIKQIPSIWDDTKFIDGYPGKFVVLARRAGARWYLTGINGEQTPLNLTLDLRSIPSVRTGQLITDGEGGNLSFTQRSINLNSVKNLQISLKPYGGFVIALD
jgi:alpha-glucosidase